MIRVINRKIKNETISKEWDNIIEKRREYIIRGDDKSFLFILLPQIIDGIKEIEKDKRSIIIDCGCGNGYLTNELSQYAKEVIGLDISSKSIELALKDYPKIKFYNQSIEEFSLKGREFADICVANMLLSNVVDCYEVCKNIYNILKSGGKFVVTIPHPCFWPQYWGYYNRDWFDYKKEIVMNCDFRITGIGRLGNTTHVHRPIEKYFEIFNRIGFKVGKVKELYSEINKGIGDFNKPRFIYLEINK